MFQHISSFTPSSDLQQAIYERQDVNNQVYFHVAVNTKGQETVTVLDLESFYHYGYRVPLTMFHSKDLMRHSFLASRYEKNETDAYLYILDVQARPLRVGHGTLLMEQLRMAVDVCNKILSERDDAHYQKCITHAKGEISPDECITRSDLIHFYKKIGCTITGLPGEEQLYCSF